MANWNDLLSKADVTIVGAKNYLKKRQSATADVREQELLTELYEDLDDASLKLQIVDKGDLKEPIWNILSEQIDLANKHVQNLHEYSEYIEVESVIGGLSRNLKVMAGPHGPGEGKPGGKGGSSGWGTGATG